MPLNISLEEAENTEIIELRIDVQGWKGEGLVRLNDGWLSVHGGLLGERLKVRVHERPHPARRRADATILDVMEPSPNRHESHCGQFNTCHGCQLRMIDWNAENRLKETKIREIMLKFTERDVHVGSIALAEFDRSLGVRMRAGLSFSGGELGLKSLGKLVPMDRCAALTTRAQLMVQCVMNSIRSDVHRIDILAPENGPAILTVHSETAAEELMALASDNVGLQIVNNHDILFQGGPIATRIQFGKHLLQAEVGAWIPASEIASLPFYEWISTLNLSGQVAIDLGCGVGGISAQLERGFEHVIGIDSNLNAVRSYSENFPTPQFECIPAKFERGLQTLAQRGARPQLITINPMREPIGAQSLSVIRHLAPQQILYVGPSPAAASKDINELLQMWDISVVAQANVHPNTHHTMLVCLLEKKTA